MQHFYTNVLCSHDVHLPIPPNWEPPDEDIPSSLCSQVANFLTTLQPHYSKRHCTPSNLSPPQCAILNTLLNDLLCFWWTKTLDDSIWSMMNTSDRFLQNISPTQTLTIIFLFTKPATFLNPLTCSSLSSSWTIAISFSLIIYILNALIPLMTLLHTFRSMQ